MDASASFPSPAGLHQDGGRNGSPFRTGGQGDQGPVGADPKDDYTGDETGLGATQPVIIPEDTELKQFYVANQSVCLPCGLCVLYSSEQCERSVYIHVHVCEAELESVSVLV